MSTPDKPTATDLRNRAVALARDDQAAALEIADRITDPWYRTQALAHIARFSSPDHRGNVLDRAAASARQAKDAYQRAAVLAWPMRAAIECKDESRAQALMTDALVELAKVDLFCSRAHACDVLFDASFEGARRIWGPLLSKLPELCPPDSHWRCARLLRTVTAILNGWDGHTARRFVETIPAGRVQDRCARDIAERRKLQARGFF